MELQEAKYVSMIILFGSNVLMTLIGICLQRFILQRGGDVLSSTQGIVSGLTSGIFLGTFLMLILPNSLDLVPDEWHAWNLGYLLIGLGFFLICLVKEVISVYEAYVLKKQLKTEKEQLINSAPAAAPDSQLTRLITLVFALGVHYFFTGVLIGGQTKDTASLWLLLTAICVHMSLVTFSVTLRLLIDNQKYLRVFVAMCLWSLMGPLGVLVTLSVSSDSSELNLVNAVLQCISAGTFVYITFIDMLSDDLIKTRFYPFVNVVLIFTGFFVFALAVVWHQHPH